MRQEKALFFFFLVPAISISQSRLRRLGLKLETASGN